MMQIKNKTLFIMYGAGSVVTKDVPDFALKLSDCLFQRLFAKGRNLFAVYILPTFLHFQVKTTWALPDKQASCIPKTNKIVLQTQNLHFSILNIRQAL